LVAGFSDRVQVVNGILTNKVEELKELLKEMGRESFDFVFVDHGKTYYLSDMLLLKENGMLRKGTVLFADKMTIPGLPKYWEYMNKHQDEFETVEIKTKFEYLGWLPDSILVSTYW
jgi:catechol O-methyltransferase